MGYKTNSLGNLRLTAVKTANYNAVPGDLVACDVSAGSFTVTLPTAPADQTTIGVVLVTQSTAPGATAAANVLTVACGGSDVFTKTGGSATAAVPLTNQQETYIYNVSGAIWSNGLGRFARASAPPTKTVAPTTTYTALAGDIVLATAGAGGFTVTLPAVSRNAQVFVKKVDSGAGTITVSPASGTIDGAASLALVVQYDAALLVCDGTNWLRINPFVGSASQENIIRANSLNQLAQATGNYSMGASPAAGNQLTNLGAATVLGNAFQWGQAGTELCKTIYQPAPKTYTIASATPAAVDTTNLTTPTFLATTTQVFVELEGVAGLFTGGVGAYYWTVFAHGATTVLAPYAFVSNSAALFTSVLVRLYVTGLTIGNTYQFDWAHATYGTSVPTGILGIGVATTNPAVATSYYGPGIMRVIAA